MKMLILLSMHGFAHAQRSIPEPNEIIVKFTEGRPKEAMELLKEAAGYQSTISAVRFGATLSGNMVSLAHVFVIRPDPGRGTLSTVVRAIEELPHIEYVAPNHHIALDGIPNDSLVQRLYWIERVRAAEAWAITSGSSGVPIGIIDSGIDYRHPDLTDRIWQNEGEVGIDALGLDRRSNGVDDDDNGFIDDWHGWDFVDTPGFEDDGDFLDPDNDPMDELGHGTVVAGVAGATGNNGSGVVGLAYGCPLMNVRAGGASGFLQEDDAAQAIVYAAQNGARVINLSFGEVSYMPLLHDAIRFAYAMGCVIVASAGNDNSSALHYPSGFDEAIAVASTDEDDFKASFSNYGSSIDVAAPGVDVWSCTLGGGYAPFSGTSLSAPLVSALAGLVLSRDPTFSGDQVRSVIETSADDIGEIGWEPYYGAGRINAERALEIEWATVTRIDEPEEDGGVCGELLTVRGTVAGAPMDSWQLFYGVGTNPATWISFTISSDRQVVRDTLAMLDVGSFEEGAYRIRLRAINKDGSAVEARRRFFVDRTPPVISRWRLNKMIAGSAQGYLLEYTTDDICDSRVWIRPLHSTPAFTPVISGSRTRDHVIFLERSVAGTASEIYVEAVNRSGQSAVEDNEGAYYQLDLSDPLMASMPWEVDTSFHIPPTFLMERAVDLDLDGRPEMFVNEMTPSGSFLHMKILEYDPVVPGRFRTEWTYGINAVPRDVVQHDGLSWLLAGAIGRSYVFKSESSLEFPTVLSFQDTGDVWASRFLQLPTGDLAFLAKKGASYQIRTLQDGTWPLMQVLANPTPGSNQITLPGTAAGDFDGDGSQELLMGDLDGDVYIYEWNGQSYELIWQDSLPLVESNGLVAAGDFDGDDRMDFAVGCHTEEPGDGTEDPAAYWLFRIYSAAGDNQYSVQWAQYYFGYHPLGQYQSGLTAADADQDGRDELMIAVYPYLYLVRHESGSFKTIHWTTPIRTNAALVDDIDVDGRFEIVFNVGESTVVARSPGSDNPAPVGFEATPLDTFRIQLTWQTSADADGYVLFRGTSDTNLVMIGRPGPSTSDTVDAGLENEQAYRYGLSVVRDGVESVPSFSAWAKPNSPPYIGSAHMTDARQLVVSFSEGMGEGIMSTESYRIDSNGIPSTAVVMESGRRVLLGVGRLSPGMHELRVSGVHDMDRTPLDTLRSAVMFAVEESPERFYVTGAEYLGGQNIGLAFSEVLDAAYATAQENYVVHPDLNVISASVDEDDPARVILEVEGRPIGALGIKYVITAHSLRSASGKWLDEIDGNKASLVFSRQDLREVFAYPNPIVLGTDRQVSFANLTAEATIRIYTLSGVFVRELTETDRDGGVQWDLRDRRGRTVGAGIYIYEVESGRKKKREKIAVVK